MKMKKSVWIAGALALSFAITQEGLADGDQDGHRTNSGTSFREWRSLNDQRFILGDRGAKIRGTLGSKAYLIKLLNGRKIEEVAPMEARAHKTKQGKFRIDVALRAGKKMDRLRRLSIAGQGKSFATGKFPGVKAVEAGNRNLIKADKPS